MSSDGTERCDHSNAKVDHKALHGTEVEFWIACPDCHGFWTLTAGLDDLTSHISDDSNEWSADTDTDHLDGGEP